MKSSDYWRQRFEILEHALDKIARENYENITPVFDEVEVELDQRIEKWLYRIAKNNQLSMAEARRLLKDDQLKEFHWFVDEYIQYGQENAINQQWMKELENASAKYHISQLEALKLQTRQSIERTFHLYQESVMDMTQKVYTEGYYRSVFEIQKGLGIGWNVSVPNEKKLRRLIKKPWAADGKNFSDRIWTAKSQMVDTLHKQLVRTCILGESPDKAIREMTKYVKKGVKNAKAQAGRLIMTEQAFFSSAAQKDAFRELGVEEYEIVATLDSRTSEICREMDGKHLPLSQYEPGVTAPPFHVWCRSTTCPYFDDEFTAGEMRAAREEAGKTYYVPADMKYSEWISSLSDTLSAQSLKTEGVTAKSTYDKLTDEELYAINEYISPKSYILNEFLREGYELTDEFKEMAEKLDRALLKLPVYRGTVYRSLDSSRIADLENFWNRYRPGQRVEEKAYISTSISGYDDSMDIQLIIHSVSGRDMRAYNPGEQEILFGRGTRFIVEKREGNTIWLREL